MNKVVQSFPNSGKHYDNAVAKFFASTKKMWDHKRQGKLIWMLEQLQAGERGPYIGGIIKQLVPLEQSADHPHLRGNMRGFWHDTEVLIKTEYTRTCSAPAPTFTCLGNLVGAAPRERTLYAQYPTIF